MKTRQQWIEQLSEARNALNDIDDKERAERNAGLVGKCFRYRNSYGGDRPKWWIFGRVVSLQEGYLTMFDFETTSDGTISITPSNTRLSIEGWEAIDSNTFDFHWNELFGRLAKMP